MPDATPRLRIICETVGPGKAALLGLIHQTHSISEAARRMGMSYARAWKLIEAMNECFREPVLRSAAGGARGGRSELTTAGARILHLYRSIFDKSLRSSAADLRELHRLLKPVR